MKKINKTRIKDNLSRYGSLAIAITGISESNAAIIYTDISPDFTGGGNSQYDIDMNNDGISEFNFYAYSYIYSSSIYRYLAVFDNTNNGGILRNYSNYSYALALSNGSTIGNTGSFGASLYLVASSSSGNWSNVNDKFLGVTFQINGNTHYGWIRLDVNTSGNAWVVKDYAYNDVPGASILAGSSSSTNSADIAIAPSASDIADNMNGSDAQITFLAAVDEVTVENYQIIIVKNTVATTFDLNSALGVASTNKTTVIPNGSTGYSEVLAATATDSDGDPIANNIPYKVFVLSNPDSINSVANTANLSDSSAVFTLTSSIGIKENPLDEISVDNFQGKLTLNIPSSLIDKGLTIDLYALNGQRITNMHLSNPINTFDLSHMSAGIYLIHINSKDGLTKSLKINL